MSPPHSAFPDPGDALTHDPWQPDETPEQDLWFLPGPPEDDPDPAPPPLRAGRAGPDILADWAAAEAGLAARLARAAGRFGALDDRLRRGPAGWRHRLALIEAAEQSWVLGDRVAPDRLALWMALHLSGARQDGKALARAGWAARRLTGGPGPDSDLAAFLGRHDPGPGHPADRNADRFADRAAAWLEMIAAARELHPISRSCMGFHLWGLAGIDPRGDRMEAAVTAARMAASETDGAVFAPLAMGGGLALRAEGPPALRLARWLDGMDSAILTALRHLDAIEAWSARAKAAMAPLSGRTPPALCAVLTEWPLVSAPMAQHLTGASRAAVQRNLAWMEARGLVQEVTGQGRFRAWRATTGTPPRASAGGFRPAGREQT